METKKEKMNINKALDIKKALITLSESLGMEFENVASNVCLFDKDKFEILKEASDTWNKFDSASIEERGAMLGIKVTTIEE